MKATIIRTKLEPFHRRVLLSFNDITDDKVRLIKSLVAQVLTEKEAQSLKVVFLQRNRYPLVQNYEHFLVWTTKTEPSEKKILEMLKQLPPMKG